MKFIPTLFLVLILLALGCNSRSSNNKVVSTHPSDVIVDSLLQIPIIKVGINLDNQEHVIIWNSCKDASKYELEEFSTIRGFRYYVFENTYEYYVGRIEDNEGISYRIRSVSLTLASKWSQQTFVPGIQLK